VYYVSPSGNDANPGTKARPWKTIQHAAVKLVAGQTVLIRTGTYRERVMPLRSGTAGRFITYAAYPGDSPLIDGARVTLPADQAGLFDISGRSWIRVIGLRLTNARPDINSNGIFVNKSHDIVIQANRTSNTRSSGIGVWRSDHVTIRGNDVTRACSGGYQESISVAMTNDFLVESNTVHGITADKEGITIKQGSDHGIVRGDLVQDVSRVGIYVDAEDRPTTDVLVEQNVVRDTGYGIQTCTEAGGPLSNVRIENNLSYDNVFWGINVSNCGLANVAHPQDNIVIVNNTVWHNGDSWGGGIGMGDTDATHIVIRNNIVSDNLSWQISVDRTTPAGTVTVDHNLVDGYRGDTEDSEIKGDAVVEGNPRFVDAARGNFHLLAGSPAIDAGSPVGAPGTDFSGTARPHGEGIDIGAFEY
jgi:nitrous oxidase accessory protein NosD